MKRFAFSVIAFCVLLFVVAPAGAQVKNIVIVHGAFADGSGWQQVHDILKARGYNVSVAAPPNTGLADDVAATQRLIHRQDGPVLLVGHSYAGSVISVAGTDPKVAGLVYVAAFIPDQGEAIGKVAMAYPQPSASGILPPEEGFLWYDKTKFHADFCADLPEAQAVMMADAQMPIAATAFGDTAGPVAWHSKPSWQVIPTEDHAIPPGLQRQMGKRANCTVVEIRGSHLVFMSHAKEVADAIEAAAKGVK